MASGSATEPEAGHGDNSVATTERRRSSRLSNLLHRRSYSADEPRREAEGSTTPDPEPHSSRVQKFWRELSHIGKAKNTPASEEIPGSPAPGPNAQEVP